MPLHYHTAYTQFNTTLHHTTTPTAPSALQMVLMKKPAADARATHTLSSVFGGSRANGGTGQQDDDDADSNDSFPTSSSQDKDSFRLHHPTRQTSYQLLILNEVHSGVRPAAASSKNNNSLAVYATLPCPYTSPELVIEKKTKWYYDEHGNKVEEEVVVEEEEEDQVSRFVVTDELFMPLRGLERAKVCLVSMSSKPAKGGGGGGGGGREGGQEVEKKEKGGKLWALMVLGGEGGKEGGEEEEEQGVLVPSRSPLGLVLWGTFRQQLLGRLMEGGGEEGGEGGLYFLLLGNGLLQDRYPRPEAREGGREGREKERKRRRSRSRSSSRGSRSRSDSHSRREEERRERYRRKEDEEEEEEERRLRAYCGGKYFDEYLAHGHPVPDRLVRREGGREGGRGGYIWER